MALDTTHFTQGIGDHGRPRTWLGFVPRDKRELSLQLHFELPRVLEREKDWDQPPAMYLISHAGQISIEPAK